MASDLISYNEWMKKTALIGRRRSDLLKVLDDNLKTYEMFGGSASRWKVGQALKAWQESKKPRNWRSSKRNQAHRSFEDLDKLLNHQMQAGDAEAYQALAEHREEFIRDLFKNRSLILSSKAWLAFDIGSSGLDGYAVGSRAMQATFLKESETLVKDALGEAYTDPGMAVLIANLIGKSVGDFIQSITPAVGLVKSAGSTLWSGLKAYSQTKLVYGLHGSQQAFSAGDPEAAFLAVQKLAKSEASKSAFMFASHGTEAGFKASGIFLDGGTATTAVAGTAATLARLIYTLKCLKKDWDQQKAVNALLKNPEHTITNDIFNTNPLLGCYFIACATDSVLLDFMFGKNMALPSFMDQVGKSVKKHLDPTRKAATHCIHNHRYELSLSISPEAQMAQNLPVGMPKLSIEKSNGIAVRSPATYHQISAEVSNLRVVRGAKNVASGISSSASSAYDYIKAKVT
jgi:hypothetical protein